MEINEFLTANRQSLAEDLQRLVRVPSVKAPALTDMPFGPACAKALEVALDIGAKLGFEGTNLDNYVGYIDVGQGEECFGVLVHLDVVPEGDGWSVEPFCGDIIDGRLYGRGAQDNKGPTVAALYALAALAQSGEVFKKRVRLIMGCDEESGSGDIDYYKKYQPMPDGGISPDGEYPLVNSEKGILRFELSARFDEQLGRRALLAIDSGTRANVVPNKAVALLRGVSPGEAAAAVPPDFEALGIRVDTAQTPAGLEVRVLGKSAHGSTPWEGVNALCALCALLTKLELEGAAAQAVELLAKHFPVDGYFGQNAGLECEDESGKLTVNFGVMELRAEGMRAQFDVRHPIHASSKELVMEKAEALGFGARLASYTAPHYVSPDSDLVKTLLEVYEQETGEKGYCIAIGGGTYARSIPGAVTFGCVFPGEEDRMHQADERLELEKLYANARILAQAIKRVCC